MRIGDLFDTPVADKIEPVIKVGERADEAKLAGEVSSYVVTPTIEKHLDDMLEHWTDTLRNKQTEIGIWISGYFGSGKSHFAKIFSLLVANPTLKGRTAAEIFETRLPSDAQHRGSILRSLSRMGECECGVLAFNLNTIADSKTRPLPTILLSQYYQSMGFSANLLYARVIEAELANQGKLDQLHMSIEKRTGKKWSEIQSNPGFYRNHLYDAVVEVAPNNFPTRADVDKSLAEAQKGELHNVRFLVQTILDDLDKREKETGKEQRLLFVLDESGQWIQDDSGRLSQLQALVEEAATAGQGKIWIIVTTHGDMGSIYKEAKALEGDMKKIEGRFRFKPALTTENIELVLEDRLFRKTAVGAKCLQKEYETKGSGTIRGLGELANVTSRSLPSCTKESFSTYYPFFPYQVNLIPEIVKSLRSKGGRGEQLSGSTRTLLAITQDILRSGRRGYLDEELGALVSYHELYYNLAGEGEVTPDVRTDIGKIKKDVPGATDLTQYVAEVLYLIRELSFIPRSIDNIARLLPESTDDDVQSVATRILPELERLMRAGMVGRTGDEYEFLTGEKRSFEEDVANLEAGFMQQDRERGLQDEFVYSQGKLQHREWLDSNAIEYKGHEFSVKVSVDGFEIPGTKGDVSFRFFTPLAIGRVSLQEIENQSLRDDNVDTVFFVSGRVDEFDRDLERYLAMQATIQSWVGDPQKSDDARGLAEERNNEDLPKLRRRVLEHLRTGIRTGHLVFRGASRQLNLHGDPSKPSKAMRVNMAEYWPRLYPKFDKVPIRIASDQRAIKDVLSGETSTATQDVRSLKLFDKAGKVDLFCPLLDGIKMHLSTEQREKRRVLGGALVDRLSGIGYGWDPNAIRVGVAALVRAGAVKVVVGQKEYANAGDPDLAKTLLNNRDFNKAELILEDATIDPAVLESVRKFIIKLSKKRRIDETPAAIAEATEAVGTVLRDQAEEVENWASGAGLPLPEEFVKGTSGWRDVLDLKNPVHRVNAVFSSMEDLEGGFDSVALHSEFRKNNGEAYRTLGSSARGYEAIEHRIPADNAASAFLAEYRAAYDGASIANQAIWNSLQSKQTQAAAGIKPLLQAWRDEARSTIDKALKRLPSDLVDHGLDSSVEAQLAQPLQAFVDKIDNDATHVQVSALSRTAEDLVRDLGNRIVVEVNKRKPKPDAAVPDGKPAPKPRELKSVRATDVATVTRVSDIAQWEALQKRLDKRVRELLDGGYDVELK